jgi:hypothetical protein
MTISPCDTQQVIVGGQYGPLKISGVAPDGRFTVVCECGKKSTMRDHVILVYKKCRHTKKPDRLIGTTQHGITVLSRAGGMGNSLRYSCVCWCGTPREFSKQRLTNTQGTARRFCKCEPRYQIGEKIVTLSQLSEECGVSPRYIRYHKMSAFQIRGRDHGTVA